MVIGAAGWRFVLFALSKDLVDSGHLRQPFGIGHWCLDERPSILALGELTLAARGCNFCGGSLLCGLQHCVERPFADAVAAVDDVAQALDIDRREIGS